MEEGGRHTDLGRDRDVTVDNAVQVWIQVLWEEFGEQRARCWEEFRDLDAGGVPRSDRSRLAHDSVTRRKPERRTRRRTSGLIRSMIG
jgi:hypothetical protein